jgi:hypothetical protein
MKKIFEQINQLYDTINIQEVPKLVNQLYQNHKMPILIGTSNGELYFDHEAIEKLFVSDLEGWGQVKLNLESVRTETYGFFQVSSCKASVMQTFDINDQVYERFVNIVTEIKNDQQGTNHQKAMLIQQLLVHLMHDRKEGKRSYDWDLDLNIIGKQGVVDILQFSMPIDEMIPDVRLDDFDDYNKKVFEAEIKKIEKYSNGAQCLDLIELLSKHIKTVKNAEDVSISPSQIIVSQVDDYISFFATGNYNKKVTMNERIDHLFRNFHNQEKPKKQLFNIRRDIAQHLLHDAIGETMNVHFRVIGIAQVINQKYIIKHIQVTLPFNVILEEKTDFAKSVDFNDI